MKDGFDRVYIDDSFKKSNCMRVYDIDIDVERQVVLFYEPISKFPKSDEQFMFKQYNFFKYRYLRFKDEQYYHKAKIIKDKIGKQYINLIRKEAQRCAERTSRTESYDDAFSEANILFSRSIDLFNFNLGYRFSTYIVNSIRTTLPRNFLRLFRHHSKEWNCSNAVDSDDAFIKIIDPKSGKDLDGALIRSDIDMIFNGNVELLDDREREIMRRRYGFNGETISMRDLAKETGISLASVSGAESSAKKKLRGFREKGGI